MSETSVGLDLVHSLDILSKFGFEHVGSHLQVLAFLVVSQSVEEPSGDTISFRIIDDVSNGISLFLVEFTCSESRVQSKDFADEEAESTTNTSDVLQGEGDGSLPIDVGVQNTMDVLKIVLSVFDDQGHLLMLW
jgi:hypothetical protein